jgi:hypothetical protein
LSSLPRGPTIFRIISKLEEIVIYNICIHYFYFFRICRYANITAVLPSFFGGAFGIISAIANNSNATTTATTTTNNNAVPSVLRGAQAGFVAADVGSGGGVGGDGGFNGNSTAPTPTIFTEADFFQASCMLAEALLRVPKIATTFVLCVTRVRACLYAACGVNE